MGSAAAETATYRPSSYLWRWIPVRPFPSCPLVLPLRRNPSVCVAGALRLYYSIITERSPDTTWEGFYLWIWEAIEINGGIVCASAPCLKSLISRILPRIFPSHASASQPLPSFETADPGTGRKGYLMTNITTGRSRNAGVVSQSESQVDLTEEGQR